MDIQSKFLKICRFISWRDPDLLSNSDPENVKQIGPKARATYVMGQDALMYFDPEMLKSLKREMDMFYKLAWRYVSNWRELHIDGFETGRPLPIHTGINYQFFQYATPEETPEQVTDRAQLC